MKEGERERRRETHRERERERESKYGFVSAKGKARVKGIHPSSPKRNQKESRTNTNRVLFSGFGRKGGATDQTRGEAR